ncbi:MAG TPA: plastocyanin/azurin family copper-binding protein, partial [Chloroflexota bacterium]|nr:plastocyanin/azurin family copper-binding protein [Chloroflexota bacterium]
PQSALVHITKQGFNPPTATIGLGGSITWENDDNTATHTATTTGGGNPQPFDTGGLQPGFSNSFTFALQGTYTYTSAIDCFGGGTSNGFQCGTYTIVVSGQPSGLAPSPAGTPVPALTPGGSTTVGIDDVNGFTPPALAIHPGQTVTWVNTGHQVHTVVSNPGYYNQFDSGGIGPGQKFSVSFPNAGSYGYHSTTEQSYAQDAFGHTVVQYALNGTIVVQ